MTNTLNFTAVQSQEGWVPDLDPQLGALLRERERRIPVVVVLADRRYVRILRVLGDQISPLTILDAPMKQQAQQWTSAAARLFHEAVLYVERHCGGDCWIVIGGSDEGRNGVQELLPQHLRERALNDATLHMQASDAEMLAAADGAMKLMRENRVCEIAANLIGLDVLARKRCG